MARCTPSLTVLRITSVGSCHGLTACVPLPPNSDVVASGVGLGGHEVMREEPLWIGLVSLRERQERLELSASCVDTAGGRVYKPSVLTRTLDRGLSSLQTLMNECLLFAVLSL